MGEKPSQHPIRTGASVPIVRTTIHPEVEYEVSDSEAIALGAQGLLYHGPVVAPEPDITPTPSAPKGADNPPLEG